MSANSRALAAQIGYSVIFAFLGIWIGLAAKQDPAFCSAAPVLCQLPPTNLGLHALVISGFLLLAGCIDLSKCFYRIVRASPSALVDPGVIRRSLILAIAQTVIAALILLAYLLLAGLSIR